MPETYANIKIHFGDADGFGRTVASDAVVVSCGDYSDTIVENLKDEVCDRIDAAWKYLRYRSGETNDDGKKPML